MPPWPFHQLGEFIQYKALRAGVPFVEVDPAYTSQRCPVPWCGNTMRANRPDRDSFRCRRCGFAGPADVIAAMNIRKRACVAWAFVSMPVPTPKPRGKGDATPTRQPAATGSATRCERPSRKPAVHDRGADRTVRSRLHPCGARCHGCSGVLGVSSPRLNASATAAARSPTPSLA
ncbi:zinc ribbon domain-containing protein [Actinoallomurus acanthiterrae]